MTESASNSGIMNGRLVSLRGQEMSRRGKYGKGGGRRWEKGCECSVILQHYPGYLLCSLTPAVWCPNDVAVDFACHRKTWYSLQGKGRL